MRNRGVREGGKRKRRKSQVTAGIVSTLTSNQMQGLNEFLVRL